MADAGDSKPLNSRSGDSKPLNSRSGDCSVLWLDSFIYGTAQVLKYALGRHTCCNI